MKTAQQRNNSVGWQGSEASQFVRETPQQKHSPHSPLPETRGEAGSEGEQLPPTPDWPVLMQIKTPNPQFDWSKKLCLIGWNGAALIGW